MALPLHRISLEPVLRYRPGNQLGIRADSEEHGISGEGDNLGERRIWRDDQGERDECPDSRHQLDIVSMAVFRRREGMERYEARWRQDLIHHPVSCLVCRHAIPLRHIRRQLLLYSPRLHHERRRGRQGVRAGRREGERGGCRRKGADGFRIRVAHGRRDEQGVLPVAVFRGRQDVAQFGADWCEYIHTVPI